MAVAYTLKMTLGHFNVINVNPTQHGNALSALTSKGMYIMRSHKVETVNSSRLVPDVTGISWGCIRLASSVIN